MQTPFLNDFYKRAKQQPQTIVLPEGLDHRILKGAAHCVEQGLARPIVLGDPVHINRLCNEHNIDAGTITVVNPSNCSKLGSYAQLLFELRKAKGMTIEQASDWVTQPIVYANCMVRAGDADGCVAGAQHATPDVVRAALQIIGVAPGVKLVSSFFVMVLPTQPSAPVIFADCALNIAPDAQQLADIALASAQSAYKLLGLTPKVAMLSFSTNASAAHVQVDKVRQATAIAAQKDPELDIIGDVQFDAAFNPKTLAGKWPDVSFDGPANIFIFPSLEAGNIGYKIAERIGGAQPIGPILQGLNQPVNDLSRGCDVEAVINTIIVTAIQSL